jgi:hypothetical protein
MPPYRSTDNLLLFIRICVYLCASVVDTLLSCVQLLLFGFATKGFQQLRKKA